MLHPLTKWAQRKDRVFIEIGLMDITNEKVDLTATHLTLSAQSGGKDYGFCLELFADVVTEESKWHKTGFHMLFVLAKKSQEDAFWTRLIKPKEKNQYIQIDWSKWVDEDEEQEDPSKGLGGYDPSQMQNFDMGGMGGGMGGDMGGDEDDEEGNLDDLDKEEELEKPKEELEKPKEELEKPKEGEDQAKE